MDNNFLFAFFITLLAGLSTGIGSLIALLAKKTNTKFLSFSLGLSAGVMLYVSFVELFPEAVTLFSKEMTDKYAEGYTTLFFFVGVAFIGIIDRLVPSKENPHEMRKVEDLNKKPSKHNLIRMGLMTAFAIAIHNFPEGIATFTAAYEDPSLGIPIAIAIAIHNIPEGIAVSVPIYHATGNKMKAFKLSFLSGLAEPLGGLVAYALLLNYMSDFVMASMFASVAGIMVYISLDELLPAAREYGWHHVSIFGTISGMIIMAISLILI